MFKTRLIFAILAFTGAAFASTCPVSGTVASLQSAGSCQLNGITFSSFNLAGVGATPATTYQVSASGPGFAGFTFAPANGTALPYAVSYVATCSASCLITGVSDSTLEIPAGGGRYTEMVLHPLPTVGATPNFNTTFAGVGSAISTWQYLGGGTNQGVTMNVNFTPAESQTPEPSAVFLFGSGLIALVVGRLKRG